MILFGHEQTCPVMVAIGEVSIIARIRGFSTYLGANYYRVPITTKPGNCLARVLFMSVSSIQQIYVPCTFEHNCTAYSNGLSPLGVSARFHLRSTAIADHTIS